MATRILVLLVPRVQNVCSRSVGSAAKVGASISCGDLEVSILVVVLETPNLSVGNERGYRPRAWKRLSRNVTGGVVTIGLTSGGVRVVHE